MEGVATTVGNKRKRQMEHHTGWKNYQERFLLVSPSPLCNSATKTKIIRFNAGQWIGIGIEIWKAISNHSVTSYVSLFSR